MSETCFYIIIFSYLILSNLVFDLKTYYSHCVYKYLHNIIN